MPPFLKCLILYQMAARLLQSATRAAMFTISPMAVITITIHSLFIGHAVLDFKYSWYASRIIDE